MTQCTFKGECRHCSNGVSVVLKDVYDIKTHIRKIIRVRTPERPFCNNTPIGTTTVKSDGTEVSVVGKQVVYEAVNYYNVITGSGYMNLYANGILTSLRYNNIYPIANMQYSKDGRALRDRSEFVGIADRWIDGLRLPEQTTALEDIKKYVARLERNEAQEPTIRTTLAWQR